MPDFQFNVAKGFIGYLVNIFPGDNPDARFFVAVLNSSGLQADSAMKKHTTLAAVRSSSSEHSSLERKLLSDITFTTDQTNDRGVLDFEDLAWANASGAATGGLVLCFTPVGFDITPGNDGNVLPLLFLDMQETLSGGTLNYEVAPGGALWVN